MHQIQFWLGFLPRPHYRELTALTALSGGKGSSLAAPFPKTQPPAVGPSGLELRLCGPQTTFID